ncbi:hypothetical protein RintRC_6844 [Richelia intracellularis]|nr:hypothetical protein RintRC_6844 [Richelia intracellularis]
MKALKSSASELFSIAVKVFPALALAIPATAKPLVFTAL